MKNLLITAILLSGFFYSNAQNADVSVLNYKALEKKYEKSNEDIKNEKKNTSASTWFSRGELLQDIYIVNTDNLRRGMAASGAIIFKGDPLEVKDVERNGKSYKAHVYERIVLYYQKNVLMDWEETQKIVDEPLPIAVEAYAKALELDEKGKLGEKIKANLTGMKRDFENNAIAEFSNGKYGKTVENFEQIMAISELPIFNGCIDSVVIYNAALAARSAEDHETSAKYFQKAVDIGYGGSDAFYLLKVEYIAMKDSTRALNALKQGYQAYPDTSLLIFELVNFYLASNNAEEGIKYIKIATEKETENAVLFFAEGTLYEKLNDPENAMKSYIKSSELNPDYMNAWFNMGALYFNQAVELYNIANEEPDVDKYEAAKKTADDVLRKALVPMEKARVLTPDERATLETLQTIYYRLQMMDKYEEVKAALEGM